MPRQGGSKHVGPWARCDRCGWQYRLDDLQMQNGLLLDAKCIDAIPQMVRENIIDEVLADTADEMQGQEARKRAEEHFRVDDFTIG